MRVSITRRRALAVTASAIAAPFLLPQQARSTNEGVTDTKIKLGTTATYSGPVSAIAPYGEAQVACFKMINDRGGIIAELLRSSPQ